MARQAQQIAARRDFWLYIDEFHNFITPSMTEILTGARKYRLGLILAHQELRQLERDREVASAVLSNPLHPCRLPCRRRDARALENGFSFFEARDLQNLETGQAICRVEKADGDFNLAVPFPEAVDPHEAQATRQAVIAASRAKYANATRRGGGGFAGQAQFGSCRAGAGEGEARFPAVAEGCGNESCGSSENHGFGKGKAGCACRSDTTHRCGSCAAEKAAASPAGAGGPGYRRTSA